MDPTSPGPAAAPIPNPNVNNPETGPSSERKERRPSLYATATSEPVRPGAAPLGPPAELAQIFHEHQGRIFRVAYRITASASDAEDVLQSVFLRLVRRDHESEGVDNLDSYLYRSAINASLDVLRARRARMNVALEDVSRADEFDSASVRDSADTLELQSWLRQALAKLNPKHAEMFVLRYVEGYDNREIAEMLETSQAVIAVTLHRIRGLLKKDFESFQRGSHV